ncbi:MAG: hypothetical protein ACKVPZ_09710 [Burkholderiaceae bacterium]
MRLSGAFCFLEFGLKIPGSTQLTGDGYLIYEKYQGPPLPNFSPVRPHRTPAPTYLKACRAIVDSAIKNNQRAGDSVIAEFASPVKAIDAAASD